LSCRSGPTGLPMPVLRLDLMINEDRVSGSMGSDPKCSTTERTALTIGMGLKGRFGTRSGADFIDFGNWVNWFVLRRGNIGTGNLAGICGSGREMCRER